MKTHEKPFANKYTWYHASVQPHGEPHLPGTDHMEDDGASMCVSSIVLRNPGAEDLPSGKGDPALVIAHLAVYQEACFHQWDCEKAPS